MKIKKWVEFQEEVDVTITAEDLQQLFSEEPDAKHIAIQGIEDAAKFIRSIPEKIIEEMAPASRNIIAGFLEQQMRRFRGNPSSKDPV